MMVTALRRLREDDLPVVMLAARADGVDRIIGLEQTWPNRSELTARIEAVLRRRNAMPAGTPVEGGECIRFGDNQLDLSARLLQNNEPVVITSGEFSLLAAFVRHPHRPLSRERHRTRPPAATPQPWTFRCHAAPAVQTVMLRVCSGRPEIPLMNLMAASAWGTCWPVGCWPCCCCRCCSAGNWN